MRVAVVGAGLVGTASAFELAADGHAVTLYERHRGVAAEASFAPGGLSSPSHVARGSLLERPVLCWGPWSGRDEPRRVHPLLSAGALSWLWRARQSAGARQLSARRARLHRLASFSQQRLNILTRMLELQYEHSSGHVVLLRSAAELARCAAALDALSTSGLRWATLDPDQCRAIEPALVRGGVEIGRGEGGHDPGGGLFIGQAGEGGDRRRRPARHAVGRIEAAVAGEAREHGVEKSVPRRLAAGREIVHRSNSP